MITEVQTPYLRAVNEGKDGGLLDLIKAVFDCLNLELTAIETRKTRFDDSLHKVISAVNLNDVDPDTIVTVMQTGYRNRADGAVVMAEVVINNHT